MIRGKVKSKVVGIEFGRSIPVDLRTFALSRAEFACIMCGAGIGDVDPYDPSHPTRLKISYILRKEEGGLEELSNLQAICSVCNAGARKLVMEKPTLQQLLIQVRRASAADQMAVLRWLLRKFPTQAEKLLNKDAKIS